MKLQGGSRLQCRGASHDSGAVAKWDDPGLSWYGGGRDGDEATGLLKPTDVLRGLGHGTDRC